MLDPIRKRICFVLTTIFETQHYALALPPQGSLREVVNQAVLRATASEEWQEVLDEYLGGIETT